MDFDVFYQILLICMYIINILRFRIDQQLIKNSINHSQNNSRLAINPTTLFITIPTSLKDFQHAITKRHLFR